MHFRFTDYLSLCLAFSSILGCTNHQAVDTDRPSTDVPAINDERFSYPREIEGVGLVFEPVYLGNTSLQEWAKNRANIYGIELQNIYMTDMFYLAVFRDEESWLIAFEPCDQDIKDEISVSMWKPLESESKAESDGVEPTLLGDGGLFNQSNELIFKRLPPTVDPDADLLDGASNLPAYNTIHQDEKGDLFVYTEPKPLFVSDKQVGEAGIFVKFHSRRHGLSYVWLNPAE